TIFLISLISRASIIGTVKLKIRSDIFKINVFLTALINSGRLNKFLNTSNPTHGLSQNPLIILYFLKAISNPESGIYLKINANVIGTTNNKYNCQSLFK